MTIIRTLPQLAWRYVRPALLLGCGLLAAFVKVLLVAVFLFPYDAAELSAEHGGPLIITDRHGRVLRSVPAADGRPGRHDWVGLDEIPAPVINTLLVSEDSNFYHHRGIDGPAFVRAAWLNVARRRFAFGGSTITMQLARMLHSPGKGRSLANKLRETIHALRLERAVGKRTILEQYLNRAYYGNGAYGIESAARLYFDRPVAALSEGQATLLAIIPRAPTAYDPIKHLDAALARREHVFGLLRTHKMMTSGQIARARAEKLRPALHRADFAAPHFVDWIISTLPDHVRASGGVVRTTLDLDLQERLARRVAAHAANYGDRNLSQAGMVVLDTKTSEILAMVGSADFHGRQGQINIVTRRRHPGSALKPFVYALAIERGDHPATIAYDVHDVPSKYRVKTLMQKEHGPVRYREALAGSYNLAAVHTLEKVGVSTLMSTLRRAGVGTLGGTSKDYGLRLALGSAKVRLVDLAAAYGFMVRDGKVRRPRGLIEARSPTQARWRPAPGRDVRIFSPQTAWLVMDMLADPEARRATFGRELPLDLPFRVAAKTGTSRGFADTVAIAATSEYIVAAWGGNFDGQATQGMQAMTSAAPMVRAGMLAVAGNHRLTLPKPPLHIHRDYVCALSGKRAGKSCPHRKLEYHAHGRGPVETCDWHERRDGEVVVRYPADVDAWATRERNRGGRHLTGQVASSLNRASRSR